MYEHSMPDALLTFAGKTANRVDHLSVGRHAWPMQNHRRTAALTVILSVGMVAAVGFSASGAEQPAQKPAKPNLYDTTADGKEQIAAALKTAKAEDKRVLLKFGANW